MDANNRHGVSELLKRTSGGGRGGSASGGRKQQWNETKCFHFSSQTLKGYF